MTIKTVPSTGDPFVDGCFVFEFDEQFEDRDYRAIDELREIADLGNRGEIDAAMARLDAATEQFADFDFIYGWRAILLGKLGRIDEARQAIRQGLTNSRSKYALCEDLAAIEFDGGQLDQAVVWWIRAAAIQLSCGRTDSLPPFVYLAYVAAALGDSESSNALLSMVDRIRPEQVRLSSSGYGKIIDLVARAGTDSMRVAIRLLCDEYLP